MTRLSYAHDPLVIRDQLVVSGRSANAQRFAILDDEEDHRASS